MRWLLVEQQLCFIKFHSRPIQVRIFSHHQRLDSVFSMPLVGFD
jgi:hypothetical protein